MHVHVEQRRLARSDEALDARLPVHVLATTPEGTTCALATAQRLAAGSDARVVLLLPRLTTFRTPFDPTGDERALAIHQHRSLATNLGVDATVLYCVCQKLEDVVRSMLGQSSIVVVGGRHNALWPSREERLTRRLTAEGYPVVFAQVGAGNMQALAMATSS